MRVEVESASNFICYLLEMRKANFSQRKIEMFKFKLTQNLLARYKDHWFPDTPLKGCGYRAIRNSGKFLDPELDAAAGFAGIRPAELFLKLPPHLVVWVDPWEVSYRLDYTGEEVTLCTWTSDEENAAPWFYTTMLKAIDEGKKEPEVEKSESKNETVEAAATREQDEINNNHHQEEEEEKNRTARADFLSFASRTCRWVMNGVFEGLAQIRLHGFRGV